jgi:hypothetical protein
MVLCHARYTAALKYEVVLGDAPTYLERTVYAMWATFTDCMEHMSELASRPVGEAGAAARLQVFASITSRPQGCSF